MPQTQFTLGAFATIFDAQERVLLSHRRDMDAWNPPGGGVESGETPVEAVMRELTEESSDQPIFRRQSGPTTREWLQHLDEETPSSTWPEN